MIWIVIWVVLMMFWLFAGSYWSYENKPVLIGTTLMPWACVLILGLVLFGGIQARMP